MEYTKCKVCSRRFKVQEWKVGIEKIWCLTCFCQLKTLLELSPKHRQSNIALAPREVKVLELRYGLEDRTEMRTLESVAQEVGVTRERIRQIEFKAIEKIKSFNEIINEQRN